MIRHETPTSDSPFTTIRHFSAICPEFSEGSLRWLIFNRRDELLQRGVIRYLGKKVLIHKDNFVQFIMKTGSTKAN